jgi:hypothetical protein
MTATAERIKLADWQSVPQYVQAVFPAAQALLRAHNKAASDTSILSIASVYWTPTQKEIYVHTPEKISDRLKTAYVNELKAPVRVTFTQAVPNTHDVIQIKKATLATTMGDGWRGANKALGGPTPLSNAIVSGLLLGGLGYGSGALIEQLLPERFVSRGGVSNSLGMLGALTGLGHGALNAATINKHRPDIGYWKSWVSSNDTPMTPPMPEKKGMFGAPNRGGNGLYAPIIPVDAFNRAVWADASRGYNQAGIVPHTNPAVAAATTGIVAGASMQARSPIISPANVINSIASAGVGLATANIAGRTLGALAGLTPAAQEKIQDTGLWAGMLHAVIPPVFGAR